MFVYGTIPPPKPPPDEPPPEEPPVPKKQSLPHDDPPKKKPQVTIVVDAEVEYFRKTISIGLLWKLLWIQLAIWVSILVFQIILILLLVLHHHGRIVWIAIAGLVGPLGFFMVATVLSIFVCKEPRGCMLGSAMGFQILSTFYAFITFALGFVLFLFTAPVEVFDYSAMGNLTTNHTINKHDASVAVFSSLQAIFSLVYILTCIFVAILFCGGACCGTLIENKIKRLSGSPILISTTITSNSPIGSPTFTASLSSTTSAHGDKGQQTSPNSGDGLITKIAKENRDTGFYLNEKLIRICLWVQLACIPLLLIVGIAAAGLDEFVIYANFFLPSTSWFPLIMTCPLFGLSIGVTFIAIKNSNGCRIGTALGFQIASAVASCIIAYELIFMLAISDHYHLNDETFAMCIVCLILIIPPTICSCLISIQFCQVSCCGRFKVNAASFCDIEEVIFSQYSDLETN